MIRESFHITGSCPYNLHQIIKQLRGDKVTAEEYARVEQAIPHLVDAFKLRGEITEAEFDQHTIRKDKHDKQNGKARDAKVLHQRRTVLLTHPEVFKREFKALVVKTAAKEKRSENKRKREDARVAQGLPAMKPRKQSVNKLKTSK
jgi:hypothetical protein